jgi:hypothetical protein
VANIWNSLKVKRFGRFVGVEDFQPLQKVVVCCLLFVVCCLLWFVVCNIHLAFFASLRALRETKIGSKGWGFYNRHFF